MIPNFRKPVFLCTLASSFFLAGCLVNNSLEGTVAGGSVVTGTVTVTDSLGVSKTSNIDTSGHYSIIVFDMKGPFVIKASGALGNTPVTYYSAATDDDIGKTVNVTPLTNLIVSNLCRQLAEIRFGTPDGLNGIGTLVTAVNLTSAEAALRAKLKPALDSLGIGSSTDLLHSAFIANHGGVDALLDLVRVEDDTSTNLVTLKNALTQEIIGTDDVTVGGDDAIPVDGSKINGIDPAGSSDWLAINTLLKNFAVQFATGLPSVLQLQGAGIFDDSANLIVNGNSLGALAGDANNVGLQLNDVRIFLDGNHTAGLVKTHFTSPSQGSAKTFTVTISKAGGSWRITSDTNYLLNPPIPPVTVSTAPAASSDELAINTLLKNFAAPFATGLPSVAQLQNTGIFDDSANLTVNGNSLDTLAGDANNVGLQLNDVKIFLDDDHTAGLVQTHSTSPSQGSARTFTVAISKAGGSWKITSDANYLRMAITPGATYNKGFDGGATKTTKGSGLQILLDPTAYNSTHAQKIAMFKVSGPGLNKGTDYSFAPVVQDLPDNTLILFVAGVAPYADPPSMLLAECSTPAAKRCVSMAQIADNSEYSIVIMDFNGVVLNGSGYKLILPKSPIPIGNLSAANFPALTSATVEGVSLLPSGSPVYGSGWTIFAPAMSRIGNPVTSIPVTWTMPAGLKATSLRAGYSETSGAFFSQVLAPEQTSASIQPILSAGSGCLYFWLNATDPDGRMFTIKNIFANPRVWSLDGLYGGCMPY